MTDRVFSIRWSIIHHDRYLLVPAHPRHVTFKFRYCVTRPRSLLVRNVASRYDPWPHFFLERAVQLEFFQSCGERKGRRVEGRKWGRTTERNSREQERITFERSRDWNWTGNREIVLFHARLSSGRNCFRFSACRRT